MDELLGQLIAGTQNAALLFIASAGLTLVFGALRIINLAHAALFIVGAVIAANISDAGGGWFLPAIVASALGVAALALVLEVTVVHHLYARGPLAQLVGTFGLALAITEVVEMLAGTGQLAGQVPGFLQSYTTVADTRVPMYGIALIGLAVVVAAALTVFLRRSSLGMQIRGAVESPELLALSGLNTRRLFATVFALGGLLAGLAGAVSIGQLSIVPGQQVDFLVQMIVVTIIGGLGSVLGAALGAVIVGWVSAVGVLILPGATTVIPFLAVAIVLLVRPQGLLGRPEIAETA